MISMTSVPALARQAEAEAEFHQGDPGPRMEMWSRRDPVTLFGAAGMYKSGWDELSRIFPAVAARFSNVSDYSFEVLVADVIGDMAYSVGFERFTGSIDGRPLKPITVRATHVYRREDGEWRSSTATATTRPPIRAQPRRRVRRDRTAPVGVRLRPLPPAHRPPRRPWGRAPRAPRNRRRNAPSPRA